MNHPRSSDPQPQAGIMDRFREATRGAHAGLESLLFSQTLRDGRASPLAYCEFLRAMGFLHEALERTLEGVGLAFLSGGGEKPVRNRWRRFARRMETAVAGEEVEGSVLLEGRRRHSAP